MQKWKGTAIVCVALLLYLTPAGAQDARFEVASIKPNLSGSDVIAILPPAGRRFTATNVSLGILMAIAPDGHGPGNTTSSRKLKAI